MFASRSPLLILVLPLLLSLVVPIILVGGRFDFLGSMTNSWIRMLGLIPFAAGIGLLVTAIWEIVRAGRTVGPSLAIPEPSGIHRRSRNPIWLGVLVTLLAQFLLYDWPPLIGYAVVLFVTVDCLLRFVVEPRLVERHGQAYQHYMETVPRWVFRTMPR